MDEVDPGSTKSGARACGEPSADPLAYGQAFLALKWIRLKGEANI